MGFKDFPDTQFFIVVNGSGLVAPLGKIVLTDSTDIAHIQCQFQKVGSHTGDERLKLEIFGSDYYDGPIFSSDWVNYSDIDTLGSTHWAGYITFDFHRGMLKSGVSYYVGISSENYTPSETSYMSVALDWPQDINTAASSSKRGAAMAVFGYKE